MSTRDNQGEAQAYSGVDNLEVMAAARNYNAFLEGLVVQNAPQGGLVLDFGAGTGLFADRLAKKNLAVTCVEADPDLRQSLEDRGYTAHASLDTLEKESCDYIYSLNVLEHIEDDARAASGIFNALKPGGKVFVYVPAMGLLYSAMDRKVGHYRRYSKTQLKTVLLGAGLTIETSRYADSLGFFATLAYKLLGDKEGSINPSGLVLYDRFVFPLSRVLDFFVHPFFGKNVFALASKTSGTRETIPTPSP